MLPVTRNYGVGVEVFLFPSNYCEVATLGAFASSTGGQLHYYKNYMVRHSNPRCQLYLHELPLKDSSLELH